ncbi:MAG: flagellar assembly protein FliW [Leptospiraceae bacterium]|nr:flagellar assembly protein FliW [Leptospiraceae bacterium]
MIEIESKPFGKINIEEKQILDFPYGLLGFEKLKKFALIEENAENAFKWLQSLEDKEIAFVLIQPELFTEGYKPELTLSELETLGLKKIEDAIVFSIVTIPNENPRGMTANLQGPVLINPISHIGAQFISRNENHPLRKLILTREPEKV